MPVHRTAIFTLHNPTRHVRAILDHALACYTEAYSTALHVYADYSPHILIQMATCNMGTDRQPITRARWLEQTLFAETVPAALAAALRPLHSSQRESVRLHVARTLLSYATLALRLPSTSVVNDGVPDQVQWVIAHGHPPQRPRLRDVEPERLSALTEFAQLADDREREIALTYLLQRSASPRPVPILFRRIEAGRDCGLFYNPDTKRFYVRLFIVSPHSHLGRRLTVVGRYVDVRTGTLYMRDEDAHYWHGIVGFGRAKTSVFVPLELGRYHEEALRYTETAFLPQRQRAHAPEAAAPVCAWLVKREERYQLHVTFRIRTPAYQATRTLLGVDRGLSSIAAGAVISGDGYQVLGTVRVGGEELDSRVREIERETAIRQARGEVVRDGARRTRIADDHIHRCANQVVELARRHCSQVIMEDLAIFSPAHRPQRKPYHPRTNFNAMLSRRQYQKLLHFVDAKLALVGLPPVRRVSPAYTSQTCSICGHVDRPQHLQLFYSRQVASGLSQSTVHHIHGMLHRALKDALLMGLVQRNVCEMVRGPRRSTREMIALSEEQARRLLELVKDDRYEALYLLALTTAMREGELLGLRWQDVDLGKATLQVRMNVQEADG